MKYSKMTLKQALEELQSRNIYHNINMGFQQQLQLFDKRVHGKNTYQFVSGKRRRSSTTRYSDEISISSKKRKLNTPRPTSPIKTPKKSTKQVGKQFLIPTPIITETVYSESTTMENIPQSPMIRRSKPLTPRNHSRNVDQENIIPLDELKKVKTDLTTFF